MGRCSPTRFLPHGGRGGEDAAEVPLQCTLNFAGSARARGPPHPVTLWVTGYGAWGGQATRSPRTRPVNG
eukprot:644955-Lingulodinium_polyedra.AAC.1